MLPLSVFVCLLFLHAGWLRLVGLDDSLLLFVAFYWRINGCFIHAMYYHGLFLVDRSYNRILVNLSKVWFDTSPGRGRCGV